MYIYEWKTFAYLITCTSPADYLVNNIIYRNVVFVRVLLHTLVVGILHVAYMWVTGRMCTVFSGLQVAPEYKPHPPIFA